MKPFHLLIATPDGLCYDGEAESLLVRTDDGDVEIRAGHTDLLASVGIGRARIRINGNDRYASAAGGFLTVARGEVKLVAITFEFSDEIDLNRANAAKAAAESAISKASGERDERLAKAKMARAMNRISVARMK